MKIPELVWVEQEPLGIFAIDHFHVSGEARSVGQPQCRSERWVRPWGRLVKMIKWRFGLAPLTVRDRTANNLATVLDFNHRNVSLNTYPVPAVVGIPCLTRGSAEHEFTVLRQYAQSLGFE
jgi:hypothetical protein